MSTVEPSEYVPVAVNCWVEPIAKLSGVAGVTAMDDNVAVDVVVGADVDVGEQEVMTIVKTTINPMVRQYPINRSCFIFIISFPFLWIHICYGNPVILLH